MMRLCFSLLFLLFILRGRVLVAAADADSGEEGAEEEEERKELGGQSRPEVPQEGEDEQEEDDVRDEQVRAEDSADAVGAHGIGRDAADGGASVGKLLVEGRVVEQRHAVGVGKDKVCGIEVRDPPRQDVFPRLVDEVSVAAVPEARQRGVPSCCSLPLAM